MVFQCIKNSENMNATVSADINDVVFDISVTEDILKKMKKDMVKTTNKIIFFLSNGWYSSAIAFYNQNFFFVEFIYNVDLFLRNPIAHTISLQSRPLINVLRPLSNILDEDRISCSQRRTQGLLRDE